MYRSCEIELPATGEQLSLPTDTSEAIAGNMVDLRRKIARLSLPSELPVPEFGSILNSVATKLAPFSQSTEVLRHLTISLESLRACSQSLGASSTYANYAHFAVSRTALENAGVSVWLLADNGEEMVRRGLIKSLDEALQGARWYGSITFAGDAALVEDQHKKWSQKCRAEVDLVLEHTRGLGLPEKAVSKLDGNGVVKSKFSLTSIMRGLDRQVLRTVGLTPDPLAIWSTASALAHGSRSVQGALEPYAFRNPAGHVVGFHKLVLMGQVSRAVDLYLEAVSRWVQHSTAAPDR